MARISNYLLTKAELYKHQLLDSLFSEKILTDSEIQKVLISIKEKGYYVWPDFASVEFCSELIHVIDEFIENNPEVVWSDNQGADFRIWGLDRVNKLAAEFYQHKINKATREAYYQLEDKNIVGFTMTNRITAVENNLGSGGGWHRDAVNIKQLKSIMYLSDVDEMHGAFQYIEKTQHKSTVTDSILKLNFKHNQNRLSEEDVEKMISEFDLDLVTLTGKAGTLLLVDTTGVHRGKPIEKGSRYAMTNYYWRSLNKGGKGISPHIAKLLVPIT